MQPRIRGHPEGRVTPSESSAREGQEPPTEETRRPAKGSKDRDGHGGRDSRAFGEAGLALTDSGRGRIARRLVARRKEGNAPTDCGVRAKRSTCGSGLCGFPASRRSV